MTQFTLVKSVSRSLIFYLLIRLSFFSLNAQNSDNKLYLGFGGGINFSILLTQNNNTLYENLSGEEQNERYSLPFTNLGNQYYFHAEYEVNSLILGVQPGTYTYRFTKLTPVISNDNNEEMSSVITIRYFSIPMHLKYRLPGENINVYAGGKLSYEHLLNNGNVTTNIIPSRITGGPIAGLYVYLNKATLCLNAGLNLAPHVITKKTERYNTSEHGIYAQSDIRLNDLNIGLSVLIPLEKSWRLSSLDCNYKKR